MKDLNVTDTDHQSEQFNSDNQEIPDFNFINELKTIEEIKLNTAKLSNVKTGGLDKILYWIKVITQLINGSTSVWICGVGQSVWDILLNYSQKIFGAQWVTSLQHRCHSSNLIGQNGFLSPRRLPRG